MSFSHLDIISLFFSSISFFGILVEFDNHSRNVSKYGKTFIALLNFIASKDKSELYIEDICSSSDIMSPISLEKNHSFVIDFFKFSKLL